MSAETQPIQPEESPSDHVQAESDLQPLTSNPEQLLGLAPEDSDQSQQPDEQPRPKRARQSRWPRILRAFIAVTKAVLVAEGIAWALAVLGSNKRRSRSSDEESDYEPVERLMDYLEGRTGEWWRAETQLCMA